MTDPSVTVDPEAFRVAVASRAAELLRVAEHVAGGGASSFTRAALSSVLASTTDIEELLDAYGAARNSRWYLLRRLVATAKLFSAVSYDLRHLLLFLPGYRLLSVEGDFAGGTREAFDAVCAILGRSLTALLGEAKALGVWTAGEERRVYEDVLPRGRLPADRQSHKVASPEQAVTSVATAFLNLAEEAAFVHLTQEAPRDDRTDWIPDPVNEARLRELEEGFHSLQSLYDTHISDTNVESLDADLPVLRGHVSVIYHLLEIATGLTHFCERHILSFRAPGGSAPSGQASGAADRSAAAATTAQDPPAAGIVDHAEVLDVLLGYALAYTSRYVLSTRGLCHEMLKRYAIQGHITVPVPRYRGFHVRPSTLVARIVVHYGSEVTMELEQETYNAGFTLDLFRANEKINAVKRRLLGAEVQAALAEESLPAEAKPEEAVRAVAKRLFAQRKLVLYDRNLTLEGVVFREGESMPELVTRALTSMLTMGKVDVEMEIMASFYGDRRVLEDIKLLAQSGYGEDDFGNNLPLPAKLQYLRK